MKKLLAHYSVHVSKDRTICLAFETKKPRRRARQRASIADEDGCHDWYPVDFDLPGLSVWAQAVMNGAIVNKLNLKKVLREQIEPRLCGIERSLEAIRQSLDQLQQRSSPGPH